ncbi:MAG TPA: helix-turn-helix transcriptional regulator [Candidatus Paceibacterota bacterium]
MIKIKGHKFYTFEEVFKKDLKSKTFREAVNTELAQLRMKKKLRETRLKKRMSQAELAKKADMPQSVIARLETGDEGFSYETLHRVASALGKKIQLV